MRRAVSVIVVVLALLAAPVAARTLTGDDGPSAGAPAVRPFVAAVDPFASPVARATADVRRAARLASARADAARMGVDVLVDKRRGLPPHHRPRDLVTARVRFLPGTPSPAQRLRRPAARALERLFAAARRDGVELAAVSGYRSFAEQAELFRRHAATHGAARTVRVIARAGHSEHQTGLAVDVAGADGRCAATACFAGTPAARWLARHAPEHGYVIRYPRGKERVTGYAYEPWHLRYVGARLARLTAASGRTLDELLGDGPPGPPRYLARSR